MQRKMYKSLRRKLMAAVVCMGVLPVSAEQIIPLPTIMQVSGLSAGDHLNLRAEPNARSEDIGDLAAGTFVEVGVVDTSGAWARVIMGERSAWVARRYLTPVETPVLSPSGIAQNLACFGTEPFWNWSLSNGVEVTFSMSEGQRPVETLISNSVSANHSLRYGLSSPNWGAVLEKRACYDGMSDRVYALQIDLLGVGGNEIKLLSGCCQIMLP
ncbi:hypothetical protein GCM10007939_08380 [Amylibacter marinus]|uniref:SH3b domain-containing protein n=1 Tax=Amylibacter marinus TaxID=1475483 RepID=A0ABQ5VTF7_9RHOB|nr:SH3 domain-containing protein [Amylibacter marinus]GLQ34555.1 hypothetical protein GCM10007939_08380 [Amylibacter marinus]